MSNRLRWNLRWRLSVLWFLEWGISGTIMTYLPIYWESIHLSKHQQGQLMAMTAVGLWLAPFVVGQVADRWMATEKYLALSHFVGGIALYVLAVVAELHGVTGEYFYWLLVLCGIFAAAYFPTVPLTTALCFRHLPDPDGQFGKVRVWGTVGWMLSGVTLSLWLAQDQVFLWMKQNHSDWLWVAQIQKLLTWLPRPSRSDCFRMSALLSFALSSFCVFLPHTPPVKQSRDRVAPLAILVMFRNLNFSLFMTVSFLLAVLVVPLYSLAVPVLLQTLGVDENWIPTVMLVGQISEFPALMLLAFCLKRLGLRLTFALGIMAWAIRYGLFSAGSPWWLVIAGLALHGVCHVFLVIVAQLYIDANCRADLRASAQNLLSFVTLGIGMPLGALLGGFLFEKFKHNFETLFAIPSLASLGLLVLFWKTVHIVGTQTTTAQVIPDPSTPEG